MTISRLEFFRFLHDVVRGWPASAERFRRCERLQTFAVLQKDRDLESSTLNKSAKYIGRDLFFARRWYATGQRPSDLSFEYPGAFLFDDNLDITIDPDGSCSLEIMTFKLFVLDSLPGKTTETLLHSANYCEVRTPEEVEENTRRLLAELLNQIVTAVYATTAPPDKGEKWKPRASWEAELGVEITAYYEDGELANEIMNPDRVFEAITINSPFNQDNIVGSFAEIQIRTTRDLVVVPDMSESLNQEQTIFSDNSGG